MLLKGKKKERHPAAPALAHQHRLGPQESDVPAGRFPAGSEEKGRAVQRSQSYVHIYRVSTLPPLGTRLICLAQEDGQRRAEGVCSGHGGGERRRSQPGLL